jgi:hypothetical protein
MGNSITDSEALHDDPVLLPKVYENKEIKLIEISCVLI